MSDEERDSLIPPDFLTMRKYRAYTSLTGNDHGENERHVVVRAAFLSHFMSDPRVMALFQEQRERLGMSHALPKWRAAVTVATEATGRPWYEIPDGEVIELDSEEAGLTIEEGFEAMESVSSSIESNIDGAMSREYIELVKAAGVPYPWLAMELIQAFWQSFWADVHGVSITRTMWAEQRDLPAQPAELHVIVEPGETVSQVMTRLAGALETFVTNIRQEGEPVVARGRRVSPEDGARLGRDAEWFYRARVKEPPDPILRIAREAYGDEAQARRRSVYDAIERARHYLSLTGFVFGDAP